MEYEKEDQTRVNLRREISALTLQQSSSEQNSQLLKEAFKVDTILTMMNVCADKCKLPYYETGLKDTDRKGVECYKTCVTKGYKLAHANLQ